MRKMKLKKIALIGTHGTGKTTIAHELVAELKKKGKNAEFLGEIVRECPFQINEEITVKAQSWIILQQYLKEIEMELDKYHYLVCDRSILDGYIYHIRKFGRSATLEPIVLEHIQTYNHLFKVSINLNYLKAEGVRSLDKKFQEEIDYLFDENLDEFNIPYHKYKSLKNTLDIILNKKCLKK